MAAQQVSQGPASTAPCHLFQGSLHQHAWLSLQAPVDGPPGWHPGTTLQRLSCDRRGDALHWSAWSQLLLVVTPSSCRGRGTPKDSLCLRLESGSASVTATAWPDTLLVAAGPDPFELTARAVAAAARLSGALCVLRYAFGREALPEGFHGYNRGAPRACAGPMGRLPAFWPAQRAQQVLPGSHPMAGVARPRAEKPVPQAVDVFGWCTWDA